jgi:glutamate/tyrosine decarboxylase-like PLP-dependent enzyme
MSDRTHDAYFVISILRALDHVDAMKSQTPILGRAKEPDYAAARQAQIDETMSNVEDVSELIVSRLEGLPIWSHPRTQINVVAPPSIASIIGALLPSIYNPNLVSDDSSFGVAQAESEVAAMAAKLIGYDPNRSAGTFTFGGTGTVLYGTRIGLEKAFPGTMDLGVTGNAVLFASTQSHYCRLNVAGWLGIGEKNVILIPTDLRNEMRIDMLADETRKALKAGKRIAAIIATMGTTDALGIDDLPAIVELRDELVEEFSLDYKPHIHADAVIGWAWATFNDYDFAANPLAFRPRTIRALAGACRRISKLRLADSLGIDFHKTGFTPYISSLFLVREGSELLLLGRGREDMPYLFQTGQRHPGMFTLETSRSGGGVLAALANLRLFGKTGMRCVLGHLVEMAELLREHLEGHESTTVLNGDNFGTVTLFRVYPDGVDTWTIKDFERSVPAAADRLREHNEYNRRIFHHLRERAMRGEGVLLSMTDCYRQSDYGEPIVGLKSYMLSPFIDEQHVQQLMENLLAAREAVKA